MNESKPDDPSVRDLHLKAEVKLASSAGKVHDSEELLRQALAIEGGSATLWTNLAAARRVQSDFRGALAAIEKALSIDPRSFLALLMKGSLQERLGETRQAALSYGAALTQAPPSNHLDTATKRALHRAHEVNEAHRQELLSHIQSRIGSNRRGAASAEARRVDLFIAATLGIERIFRQEPSEFFYPGLPAIEFHERDEFPWLATLEAATADIRDEAVAAISSDQVLTPYIAYPEGLPLDQWAELNHSPRWSAFHFHHMGKRFEENGALCPKTMQALSTLPQPRVSGRMPAAMFSVLRSGTRIPSHTGVANFRLVVHLPLIVPPGCGFRVGNETREWRVGEAWVFDDTIEHEAWNLGDRDRIILICDIWNPRLSLAERELITQVMIAMDEFNGFVPATGI